MNLFISFLFTVKNVGQILKLSKNFKIFFKLIFKIGDLNLSLKTTNQILFFLQNYKKK